MKCKKDNCLKEEVASGFCRKHYIESMEEIYLDNTEILTNDDKGILRWLKDMS